MSPAWPDTANIGGLRPPGLIGTIADGRLFNASAFRRNASTSTLRLASVSRVSASSAPTGALHLSRSPLRPTA